MTAPGTGASIVAACEHLPRILNTETGGDVIGACAACIDAALAAEHLRLVRTDQKLKQYRDIWIDRVFPVTGEDAPDGPATITQLNCRNLLLTAERDELTKALDAERAAGRAVVTAVRDDLARIYASQGVDPDDSRVVNAAPALAHALGIARAYLAKRTPEGTPPGVSGNVVFTTPPRPGREETIARVRRWYEDKRARLGDDAIEESECLSALGRVLAVLEGQG